MMNKTARSEKPRYSENVATYLRSKVDVVNQMFDDMVTGKVVKPYTSRGRRHLTFGIARKWSSWYPTYFKTPGGCYVFVTRDPDSDEKRNAGVIVIDPGFNFAESLRKYLNIEPHDVRTAIVSHFHPDHTMGLYELLPLVHESHRPCDYYLNESTFDAFRYFHGTFNNLVELRKGQGVEICNYVIKPSRRVSLESDGIREKIYLTPVQTFHREIGNRHTSLGLIFDIESGKHHRQIVLLGDTDGNDKYLDTYLKHLRNADVAVLHLGAFTEKGFGRGYKHLYKSGLINILNCINCTRDSWVPVNGSRLNQCLAEGRITRIKSGKVEKMSGSSKCLCHRESFFQNLRLVIVSELGLDVASMDYLVESTKGLQWCSGVHAILLFAKFYNMDDEYVRSLDDKTRRYGTTLSSKEKTKVYRTLFATATLDTLSKMSQSIPLSFSESTDLFFSSACFAVFLFYLVLPSFSEREWEEILPAKNRTVALTGITDELLAVLRKISEIVGTRRYLANELTFEDFLEEFETPMHEFIRQFAWALKNFIVDLLISSHEISPKEALGSIEEFARKIFISTKSTHHSSLKKKEHIDYKESRMTELLSFIQSISLYDEKTQKMIRHLFEVAFDFEALAFLISYEITRQVRSFSPSEIASIERSRKDNMKFQNSVASGLLELLNLYSLNGSVKYLLADTGLELKLFRELKIRKERGPWVSLHETNQAFNEKGELTLVTSETDASSRGF